MNSLEKPKASAPKVPPDTCPYIDMILEMLDHMEDQLQMDDMDHSRVDDNGT